MSANANQHRLQRDCRAFTLVELLVVISIITLLASTALFTMYGVREDVRETRARAQVAKINELIMEKWESYQTRALPIRIPAGTPPRVAAALRLNAVRELMRMELPDRMSDLYLRNSAGNWFQTTSVPDPTTYFSSTPVGFTAPPSIWLGYQRRIIANASRGKVWTRENQHAECLYLIIAGIRENDTTGLEWFDESEVGDVDNDGMPEILDPWRHPIFFLRWAPGYASELQNPTRREPDPFDPLRVDPRWENNDDTDPQTKLDDPYALHPLIYSAGRDGRYGVVREDYDTATNPATDEEIVYGMSHEEPYNSAVLNPALYPLITPMPAAWPSASGLWAARPMNDPYLILPKSGDYVGRQFSSNNASDVDDDITNHLLETR
jgi:prepilin-type N-terminal cleavage/methylation domain-containing protein